MDLKILQIASNTENNKIVKNHTHNAKLKNPICGDEMEIRLNVKDEKILDFGYQCKSCVYCQASVSLLSRNVMNKSIIKLKISQPGNSASKTSNLFQPSFGELFFTKPLLLVTRV